MAKTIMHIAEAPGGVERYLVTLLTKMKKYEEYDHILVCSNTFDIKKFKGLVKSIVVIDSMHNAISISDIISIFDVRKMIKRYRPHIIYCHSSKAGAIGRIANFGIKNKLIYNAHGWAFNIKGASKKKIMLYEFVERLLAPLATNIVCISEYEKKSALAHKICRPNKLVVINNGIDFDECNRIKPKSREEMNISKNAFVVGTIGRLTLQKAPDTFVKMAKIVKKCIPESFFIIVGDDIGDGKYREETEKQIRDAGLRDSFIITGWVDDPLDYVGIFDVATLLSRWEGFGLVLPEYMLSGKPIVATKADAIPYVIGNAGILVDIDDYKKAADCIIRIRNEEKLYSQLVNRGKKRVIEFDANNTARSHYSLLQSLFN